MLRRWPELPQCHKHGGDENHRDDDHQQGTKHHAAPSGSLNSHVFENLFLELQDADDPGRSRLLFGHNMIILLRDDNLSSRILPTIHRSLILEEHGSTNTFGAHPGLQLQTMLSPKATLLVSIRDNRGLAGTAFRVRPAPLAAKIVLTPLSDGVQDTN